MDCTSCGRANRTGARFCGGCGASLALRCPACGSETDAGARFCDACGAPVAGREPAAEARKVVTIVFADLMGSTALHERLDAESARAFMERYYAAMRESVEAERGQVTQLLGDGVKAVFGAPRVAEDDALRAVRAAVAMQRAFRALAEAQRERVGAVGLRVAVHTGEVVAQDQSEIIGDPVNVAAHLQQQARDGDVLLGESTQRLVGQQLTLERVGTFALKGRAEPVTAWRVVSLERPAGAPAYAFVGRDEELRRILAVYETAVAGKSARLAVVLGSPGLGKSRLLAELGRRLGDGAAVLAARCDATGGETFAPLAEALRAHLCGEADAERESVRAAVQGALPRDLPEGERIAAGVAALLAGEPASPEETFFVVRRLLAALAAERPVVLCVDDLHWAEPLLLDLTEHLVQWGEGVPLLVLAAARPELRDRRSSLCAPGALVSEVVTLGGLDAGAATRLAANAIGADELPPAIVGRVLAASEGNPLFVGELARMLVQDGALVREGDRWVAHASLAELEMPPTIQALLAARIERLRPEERAVLERAAVVGRHFSRAAVAELLPAELRGELDLRLEALRRSELIEPDTGWLLGEPVLRFHHVLIRDAAYRRLLKGTRAELHARFADWLVARAGDAPERDEMLGWHLEQAHALLCELGPLDARGHALGERAATHLAAAGRRALARDDLALAAGLLGRAFERLDAEAPTRAELALDWCEALLAAGDVGPAARAVDELGRSAGSSTRLRAWHVCFAAQLAALTDPQALRDTADAVAAAAHQLAEEGDAAGEAKAHSVHAQTLARLGRIGASEGALDLALAAARRGGDRRRSNAVLSGAPVAALWGPSPVTRASGRCLDVVRVLRITQGAPAVEAVALRCQAVLEALRGRTDAARRMIASSRRLVEELGITQRLLEAELFAGRIELIEGDAAEGERCLRRAHEGLRAQGLDIDAAQAAALLGRALLAQGRVAEAESLSYESEALAGDDRIAGIAWRGVRAEALARRGEHAAAVELARAAVESAAATDALLDHADARMALAQALRAAGRAAEALAEEERAVSLWEAKGATLLVERARAGRPAEREPAADPRAIAAPARRIRPNAANAAAQGIEAAVLARDADAVSALVGGLVEVVEHATGATLDGAAMSLMWRSLIEAQDPSLEQECLATLGESLALMRSSMRFSALRERGTTDFGPVQRDELVLVEVGADGQQRRIELFAADRLADAIARLYARYAELLPEGAERERAAATARAVAGQLGPFELEVRVDDVLMATPEALLARWTSAGRERTGGGHFEWAFLRLFRFGADGQLERYEVFDAEREAEALARFAALSAPATQARFANTASRCVERSRDCWRQRDWEGVLGCHAPDCVMEDRRSLVRLQFSSQEFFANQRLLFEIPSLDWSCELLATRGEHLALMRVCFEGQALGSGQLALDHLGVAEADAEGRVRALVLFDPAEREVAAAELDRRFAAQRQDGARRAALTRAFTDAFAAREWEALAALLSPDLVVRDHRPLGWETLRGAQAYVGALRSLVELSPDVRLRVDHAEMSDPGYLYFTSWQGTREGGAFEEPSWIVCELDEQGRICGFDQYAEGQQAAARARLAAIGARRSTGPLRIPPNAASRASDRWVECIEARDWDALRALCAPIVFEDRRRLNQTTGDCDLVVANNRAIAELGARPSSTVLATSGDRIALLRVVWAGGPEGGAFEVETLQLVEVDPEGRVVASVIFDPDDHRAASLEMFERYARGDAAGYTPAAALEALRAMNAHDLDRLRTVLPNDFVFHDHRRTGLGRLEAGAFIASLAPLFEQASDLTFEALYTIAIEKHGELALARVFGTLAQSGGAVDSVYLRLGLWRGDRIVGMELFEPEDLEQARARFEALRAPDPLRIPPNAATRASERWDACVEARDWDGLTQLFTPDFGFEDRRRLLRDSGDREKMVMSVKIATLADARAERTLVATAGERIALEHMHFSVMRGASPVFEVETLQITEVCEDGHIVGLVSFDPDDRRAATVELRERFFRGEGAAITPPGAIEHFRAWHDQDLARMRATLPDGFWFHDHRRTGAGRIDGADAYIDSVTALFEQVSDVNATSLYHVALEAYGSLAIAHNFGTSLVSGGAVESAFVRLSFYRDGEYAALELFELEDLEQARARFEALRPAPAQPSAPPAKERVLPNAATRAMRRFEVCVSARDWQALTELHAPEFMYEDRRPLMRDSGNREKLVASVRLSAGAGARESHTLLATAGNRLALIHQHFSVVQRNVVVSELETLLLMEVDAEERFLHAITFDPASRAAAESELRARFEAAEPAQG